MKNLVLLHVCVETTMSTTTSETTTEVPWCLHERSSCWYSFPRKLLVFYDVEFIVFYEECLDLLIFIVIKDLFRRFPCQLSGSCYIYTNIFIISRLLTIPFSKYLPSQSLFLRYRKSRVYLKEKGIWFKDENLFIMLRLYVFVLGTDHTILTHPTQNKSEETNGRRRVTGMFNF